MGRHEKALQDMMHEWRVDAVRPFVVLDLQLEPLPEEELERLATKHAFTSAGVAFKPRDEVLAAHVHRTTLHVHVLRTHLEMNERVHQFLVVFHPCSLDGSRVGPRRDVALSYKPGIMRFMHAGVAKLPVAENGEVGVPHEIPVVPYSVWQHYMGQRP